MFSQHTKHIFAIIALMLFSYSMPQVREALAQTSVGTPSVSIRSDAPTYSGTYFGAGDFGTTTSSIAADFSNVTISATGGDAYFDESAAKNPSFLFNIIDGSGNIVYSGYGTGTPYPNSPNNPGNFSNTIALIPGVTPWLPLIPANQNATFRVSNGTSLTMKDVYFEFDGSDQYGNRLSNGPYQVSIAAVRYVQNGVSATTTFMNGAQVNTSAPVTSTQGPVITTPTLPITPVPTTSLPTTPILTTPVSTSCPNSNPTLCAQVQNLYVTLLNRQPDQAGLNYWVNSGFSLTSITNGIKGSAEYNALHPVFQGAPTQPTSPTVAPAPTLISVPLSPATVTTAPTPLINVSAVTVPTCPTSNPTNCAAIQNLYVTLLNRQPDQAGWDYWNNTGMSVAQISNSIMGTSEYLSLHPVQTAPAPTPTSTTCPTSNPTLCAQVQNLYVTLLNRSVTATDGGLNYWVNSGMSLTTITNGIKSSAEYQQLHANGSAALDGFSVWLQSMGLMRGN